MNDRASSILVGVDAGGSKTTAWVTLDEPSFGLPTRLGCGHAGPANVRAEQFDSAVTEIMTAIDRAIDDAKLSLENLQEQKICIAAAGAGRESDAKRLNDWATKQYPSARVYVTHDARPVLAATSEDQVGIALICGTGSFAWGRNARGEEQRCGGWGYLFGDEGSGYAIGIAALRAVSQAADGRIGPTRLTDPVCERFGVARDAGLPRVAELVRAVDAKSVSRADIAKISEIVFNNASDPAAERIIREAASSLAKTVNALSERLQLDTKTATLAISGGLIVHQPLLLETTCRLLDDTFGLVSVVAEPVGGAIRLARTL